MQFFAAGDRAAVPATKVATAPAVPAAKSADKVEKARAEAGPRPARVVEKRKRTARRSVRPTAAKPARGSSDQVTHLARVVTTLEQRIATLTEKLSEADQRVPAAPKAQPGRRRRLLARALMALAAATLLAASSRGLLTDSEVVADETQVEDFTLPSRWLSMPLFAGELPNVNLATPSEFFADLRVKKTTVRPAESLAAAAEPTEPLTGTLALESDPIGATVFIDRKHVGETPLFVPDLRAGSHVVWVESQGRQRWTTVVQVAGGMVSEVVANLDRAH